MSQPKPEQSDSERKDKRDQRAIVIAELLRMGHDPKKISAALKITDAGGSVYDALAALL